LDLEQKILFYADKRVCHDKVVSLKQRLEEGFQRYSKGQISEAVINYNNFCYTIEKELSANLNFQADEITEENIQNSIKAVQQNFFE
jgi:hypothetical protein